MLDSNQNLVYKIYLLNDNKIALDQSQNSLLQKCTLVDCITCRFTKHALSRKRAQF